MALPKRSDRSSVSGVVKQFYVPVDRHDPKWRLRVKVFATAAALHKATGSRANGFAEELTPLNPASKHLIGEMSLQRGKLNINTISHECLHFVFSYFRRQSGKEVVDISAGRHMGTNEEEWICHTHGDLTERVYHEALRMRVEEF